MKPKLPGRTLYAVIFIIACLVTSLPGCSEKPGEYQFSFAEEILSVDWEPSEDLLQYKVPTQRSDLPKCWQELSDSELLRLTGDLSVKGKESLLDGQYSKGLKLAKQQFCIASLLGVSKRGEALIAIFGYLRDLGRADEVIGIINNMKRNLSVEELRNYEYQFARSLGEANHKLGRYTEAVVHFDDAVQISITTGDQGPFAEGDCLKFKAESLIAMGQYYAALECLNKALRYYAMATGEDTRWVVADVEALKGDIYMLQGKYSAALKQYEPYLDSSSMFPEFEEDIRTIKWNLRLCKFYLAIGKTDIAEQHRSRALTMAENIEHPALYSDCLIPYGSIITSTEDLEAGMALLNRALDVYQDIGSPHGIAQAELAIAELLSNAGSFETAIQHFQISLEKSRECRSLPGEIKSHTGLGQCYLETGDLGKAEESLNRAVVLAISCGQERDEARSRMLLGRLQYINGELVAAEDTLVLALDLFEELRVQFAWESGLGESLVEGVYEAGSLLVQVQLDLAHRKAAWMTMQKIKAAPLSDMLAMANTLERLPGETGRLDRFHENNARIQQMWLQVPQAEGIEQQRLINEIDQLKRETDAAWNELCIEEPMLAMSSNWQPASPRLLADKFLAPNELLLDYLVCFDEIVVFVFGAGSQLKCYRLPLEETGQPSLSDYIEATVAQLGDLEVDVYRQASTELYNFLIDPVAQHLAPGTELVVCPDGDLYRVPFAALSDDEGNYLAQSHSVSYINNPAFLGESGQRGNGNGALVVGVSHYCDKSAASNSSKERRQTELPDLPYAKQEAETVAGLLGVDPLLDAEAGVDEIFKQMPGRAVVHLAAHGELTSITLLNGIHVFNATGTVSDETNVHTIFEDPGFIAFYQIMGIDMTSCDLATLSCCRSAAGEIAPGQGLMGLTQAFLYAGASSVIATQDRVDDKASLMLMTKFYENWNRGENTAAECLRQAQLALLEDEQYAAPRFWMPYVLYIASARQTSNSE